MIDLQRIRGVYEQAVINACAVPVKAENQYAGEMSALDEYCVVTVSFGKIQESVIGGRALWNVRGSLVCEIYAKKNIGPGRGMQIAAPIIEALSALNERREVPGQAVVARVGEFAGPAQAQLQDGPHHYTRFSVPVWARQGAETGTVP